MTRSFDFEPGVLLAAAVRVAIAALEDEGLALTAWQAAPRIRLVLIAGVARLVIPGCRIVPAAA